MSDDSEIDDITHEELIKSVTTGVIPKKQIRKTIKKISTDDLLGALKTAKQSTAEVRKALKSEEKEAKKSGTNKTLAPPVHRQEQERIQGAVGYVQLKKDLGIWRGIVESNRIKDQLVFPLHQEKVLSVDSAADKTDGFVPKTDMEKMMAELLNNSKHNLKNDTVYTQSELEIIKAMNIKEAKEKLSNMQKMRALVSYREAKYRYAKKIKSKGYHRLLKREKRKQLVKEFDELLVRDPDAAKQKLEELENMRVLERGSLRHHARTKFQQTILKHAGKDPAAKKILEEHLRLGRDLKSKTGLESDNDDSATEIEKSNSIGDIIKSAALAAASADNTESLPSFDETESRQLLFEMRAKKRAEIQKAKGYKNFQNPDKEKPFEENNDWTTVTEDPTTQPVKAFEEKAKKKLKKLKKKREVNGEQKKDKRNIDNIFNDAEAKMIDEIKQEAEEIRNQEKEHETSNQPLKKKKKKRIEDNSYKNPVVVDISLDPKHFLQIETESLTKVSADLVERMDEFENDQERIMGEAFKDDDVIGEFEKEKKFIEEGERPKDVDLTLQGWGCWVGPGMSERKRRKQFIIKGKEKRRRDNNKGGVIMREQDDEGIQKLQPRNLPFPYTRVEDFQAVMKQPLGKDWNPVSVSRQLCKPNVVTQGGRSIRPLNKAEAIKKRVYESEEE